jgi:inner membrane protein
MDNVCHTLAGVATARAGLDRTTRFATATLAIASNLPDIDVLVFATGIPSVAFRRGWTHGVLAQLFLPLLLAALIWAADRWAADRWDADRGSAGRRTPPAHFGWLLVLSYIGVITHVFLDYLNNYGVRLFMPLSGRWFYGDTIFIVDLWLWAAFGIATVMSRAGRTRCARIGLAAASLYIAAMLISARSSRAIVAQQWTRASGRPPHALMVGPVPVNPLRKAIIVDAGDRYVTGTFTWLPLHVAFDPHPIPKNDTLPAVAAARANAKVQGILVWSRFPFWKVRRVPAGTEVTVGDVRFPGIARGGFSATAIVRD